MNIRKTDTSDRAEIEKIHTAAFGKEKGPEIADLVMGLFEDKTARPLLSLAAEENNRMVGHILYTHVTISQTGEPVSARILAPLAVLPDTQNKGIGTELINEGLKQLAQSGVELVFVLGHPEYYPRCGFAPAGERGFEAPYSIPEEHAGAWMVKQLNGDFIGRIKGTVQCADVLDRPEHWRE